MGPEEEFKRKYLGEFVTMGHEMRMEPLDKEELGELMNMMFRFHLRTKSYFKIEEYAESTFILTDVDKLEASDLKSFHRRNQRISHKIWFTQVPPNKRLVNVYEDCAKQRKLYYPPYTEGYNFMNILSRTQSMSFILDQEDDKTKTTVEYSRIS